jgi:hypothetical protein
MASGKMTPHSLSTALWLTVTHCSYFFVKITYFICERGWEHPCMNEAILNIMITYSAVALF